MIHAAFVVAYAALMFLVLALTLENNQLRGRVERLRRQNLRDGIDRLEKHR